MMLSGNLSNWSVPDLLQIMRVTEKTAALRIEGTRAGVIHFNDGKLVGANLAGQRPASLTEDPRRAIVDALFVLTSPSEGSFFVASPEMDPDAASWDVTEILNEIEQLRQIEEGVLSQGVNDSTHMLLRYDVPAPITLSADDWSTLVSLVPQFSLASLERNLGRTRALNIMNTLLARSLTVIVEMDDVDDDPETLPAFQEEPERENEPDLDWLGDHPVEGAVDLSTEFVTPGPVARLDDPEETDTKRELKGVVASADTTLVSGVLDEMRRLRTGSG
jgi:hypothetical protein